MAALASSGAKVGVNYLKHYGKRAVGGESDTADLHSRNASEVYDTFSKLKGGPLKVAQMLSIDSGLLPEAYATQFSQAQYSAPPLSYPLVARTFRRELGCDPLAIFESFEQSAAHGASIGQVHKAVKNGQTYAVKVQYPGVADSLQSDLRIIRPIAVQMFGLRDEDVAGYFREVEARLLEETDYAHELTRSMALSAASSDLRHVAFTRYYPEYSTKRILTMDWVDGEPLDRFADGPACQNERNQIGQALWDFYHFQIHTLRVFHADPHPGNFLCQDGTLWPIDFGCTKQIDEEFYHKQFRFLDPALLDQPAQLLEALRAIQVILPNDSTEEIAHMLGLCRKSLELLAAPFRSPVFDFGDPTFMQAIYAFGEENRRGEMMRRMRGERGSPHSLYVNRTYFGLYALLSRLRAEVQVCLPSPVRETCVARDCRDVASR